MYALGGYIFYAQHNFPRVMLKDNDQWDYLDAALNSSSYIKMSRVMHWFTANIGYHHIHHVNPRIPFLPLTGGNERLFGAAASSRNLVKSHRNPSLPEIEAVDEEREKMVSLAELRNV